MINEDYNTVKCSRCGNDVRRKFKTLPHVSCFDCKTQYRKVYNATHKRKHKSVDNSKGSLENKNQEFSTGQKDIVSTPFIGI